MLEMVRNIFILTGILLIVFFAAQYFRVRTDYRSGFFHKAGSLLLYGFLKGCTSIAYGLEYVGRKVVSVLCDYHAGDDRLAGISRKEQHKRELHREFHSFVNGYTKTGYKLRILK